MLIVLNEDLLQRNIQTCNLMEAIIIRQNTASTYGASESFVIQTGIFN